MSDFGYLGQGQYPGSIGGWIGNSGGSLIYYLVNLPTKRSAGAGITEVADFLENNTDGAYRVVVGIGVTWLNDHIVFHTRCVGHSIHFADRLKIQKVMSSFL